MKVIQVFLCLLIFLTCSHRVFTSKGSRYKRQADSKCGGELKMLNCDMIPPGGSTSDLVKFSRLHSNEIRSMYTPGNKCEVKSTQFLWMLYDEEGKETIYENYSGRETYVLPSYSHDTGVQLISVYVYEYDSTGEEIDALTAACTFEMLPEDPTLVITGGPERTVEAHQTFTVSAKESIDLNVPSGKPGNLTFLWSCETSPPTSMDFCKITTQKSKSHLYVPSLFATPDTQITFSVSIKNRDSGWVNGTQVVKIVQGATIVELVCLKNCFPLVSYANTKMKTKIKANCLIRCTKILTGSSTHKWTLSKVDGSWTSGEKLGNSIYTIEPDTMTPGSIYSLKCEPNVPNGSPAFMEIKTHKPGELKSCSVTPTSGKAFVTLFLVDCQYTGSNYVWEIYSLKEKSEILVSRGTQLKHMNFILGSNAKIKVKMVDRFQYSQDKTLNVNVASMTATSSSSKEKADKLNNMLFKDNTNQSQSLPTMMEEKRYEDAFKIINAAIDEVVDDKGEEIVKHEKKVLEVVDMIPSNTDEKIKQKAAIATKLVTKYMDKPDPTIAKIGTDICKNAATDSLKFLEKERFPHDFKTDVLERAKVYTTCSQAGSTPNPDKLIPENITIPTLPYPTIAMPAITENYPDYLLDPNVTQNLREIKQSVYNMVQICYTASKTITTVMVPQEERKKEEYKQFQVTATKNSATESRNLLVSSQGVDLLPTKDFLQAGPADVNIMLCTSKTNPFWWNKKIIVTDVAMVQFELGGNTVSSFEEPYVISFKTNDKINDFATLEVFPERTPWGRARTKEEEDFEKLTVFRIDVFKNTKYTIEFINLTATDSFDAYITYFEKPSYEIFQKEKTEVSLSVSKLSIEHQEEFNAWYYLSVLKNSKTNSGSSYKFAVYSFSCYKWDQSSEDWIYSCGAASNSTLECIVCHCYSSSVITGHLDNANVKLERTLMEEQELEFEPCYVIFIALMVLFGLYCIFLSIFSVFRKVQRQPVYFLGDIPSHYHYGYLFIVKTGNRRNSGTSSNVMFKLYGSNTGSEEHVLNYPDPDMNMLQRNQEDWFFVATERYLGSITKLDLWIDLVGQNPTWYCSEIEILDLQNNQYSRFKIEFFFELKDGHYFQTAFPGSSQEKQTSYNVLKIKNLKSFLGEFRGIHMWNIFKGQDLHLDKIKRLTIMLSICLTIYTVTMFFYSCPQLKYSDVLGQFREYWFHYQMLLAAFVAVLLTSAIHIPIVWIFRLYQETSKNENSSEKDSSKIRNTICWCFIIFIIVSTMVLLLIVGFWVPKITSFLWLTSTIISIVVYVFVVENILRIFTTTYFKNLSREEQIIRERQSILAYVDEQRQMLYSKFGPLLLRPYFEHLYKPPDEEIIREKELTADMKERILEVLEDLVMIIIYVVLLYVIVLAGRDELEYHSNKEVKDLIRGTHSRTIDLEEVNTMNELQNYIKDTLIYSLQSPQWYDKYIAPNPGQTIDYTNKYIGVARLRQHRSDNTSCSIPNRMEFLNTSCISEFGLGPVYGNFSEEWQERNEDDPEAFLDDSWRYTKSLQAGTLTYVGMVEYYPGGGYITPLGRTYKNSALILRYLEWTKWFDRATRSLFVEFLLYSTSSNLFNYVRVTIEFSPTGYLVNDLEVHTARLLFIKEDTSIAFWIVFVAFVITVTSLTIKIIYKVVNKKRVYFKDLMNVVDILIICLSFTCLFLYADRTRLVGQFLTRLQAANHNEFIPYFHLFYTDISFTILTALLVFLATLRLWKLLRFLLIIKIVEKTLLYCSKPILCLCLWQMILLFSYSIIGMILFQDESNKFAHVRSSVMTLLMISLGFESSLTEKAFKSSLQVVYHISFMIINLLITTLYVTIITISYNDAQVYYSNRKEYTVVNYLKEKIRYYNTLAQVKMRGVRLRGGEDVAEEDQIYPKWDEHRFAKCLTISKNKMETMLLVALCTLRNVKEDRASNLNSKDMEIIKNIIVGLYRDDSDDSDIFYISNLQGFEKTLVDDGVFVKMEKIVHYLLTKSNVKVSNRNKELYEKICRYQREKMKKMNDNLSVLSSIVNQIEFGD